MPKNDDDTRFILSLRYSRWDSKNRQWIVPHYQGNLDIIKERFGTRVNRLIINRPRREQKLPEVLSTDEIKQLFAAVKNRKHRTILMLGYSAGLRLGEIVRLRISDIDRDRMQIRVVQSKGKKDRYTKLSDKFLPVLDAYIGEYCPKEYLFEGVRGDEYSTEIYTNLTTKSFDQIQSPLDTLDF